MTYQVDYFVRTKHPNGYMDGTHLFTVKSDQDKFYVTAKGFGCSKSYSTPKIAIVSMCADHACTAVSIVEV